QSGVDLGLVQTRNGNVNLKWETTTQTNVGVDLGFLNGDLNLTLDYFNKDTKDLLWRRALPASIGGTNMTV
ncbi:TonB-dependent receptor, partial [Extibacter sp. GGCC_0201]|nr:TonB-dependent receptor [Extibacter sp. GGCC_0201]